MDGEFFTSQFDTEITNGQELTGTDAVCGETNGAAFESPSQFTCIFNTSVGGLALTTDEESNFDLVKQISETVQVD